MSLCHITTALWTVVVITLTSVDVIHGAKCATGSRGVRSCVGRADGKYQHCDSCKVYVVCKGGGVHQVCPCSPDKVWKDTVKKCDWWSGVCHWTATHVPLVNCGGPPAGQAAVLGKKPITCITFDLLNWNGKFLASNGVHLDNFAVDVQQDCGVAGDCGRFSPSSKLQLPYFKNNDFFEFSLSLWFKRMGHGDQPVLASNSRCTDSNVVITSRSDTSLYVKVKGGTEELAGAIPTLSQSDTFHHIVVTFYSDRATQAGRARIYFDGQRIARGTLQGKMRSVSYPMMIGASECPVGKFNYFTGLMDSISFAESELSADDVTKLYESNGQCIDD